MRRMNVWMLVVGAVVAGSLVPGPAGMMRGLSRSVSAHPPQQSTERIAPAFPAPDVPSDSVGVAARKRIDLALDRPCDLEMAEMPLKDVVLFLQETHGIPIYLRKKKLEEAGISPDAPVSFSLSGIPLRSALDLLLDELELTYTVNNDVLLITSSEDAEDLLETRVYDCRDLLGMPAPKVHSHGASSGVPSPPARSKPSDDATAKAIAGAEKDTDKATEAQPNGRCSEIPGSRRHGSGGVAARYSPTEAEKRADSLMGLIRATVRDDVDGGGAIDSYNGLLVISQSYKAHRVIERLLDDLRLAASIQRTDTP